MFSSIISMTNIDMASLKKLREITFAPLKDCKEALVEANGDLDRAQEILKEKGILKAGKKADRMTNEGFIKVIQKDGYTYALKLLCETDFVAKNEFFLTLFDNLLEQLTSVKAEVRSIKDLDLSLADSLNNLVSEFIGKMGENTKIGDVIVSGQNAYAYNHPGNKVASIIFYSGDENIAKEIALQVAAMNPEYLSFEDIAEDYRNELLAGFRAEVAQSGKPENMIEQIAMGKYQKQLSDSVLLEQEYIRDGGKRIKDIMINGFTISGFIRLAV